MNIFDESIERKLHLSKNRVCPLLRNIHRLVVLLGLLTLTMISNVSALAAMYASYPLYLIRTRQQYQIVPENMFEMIGRIWR